MTERHFVLVVEDDPLQMMMAGDIVEDAGFQPVYAKNADEAPKVLESRSDIQIVLTDVNMPGSMDGLQLTAIVHERWPPIGIMVVSGDTPREATALAQRSQFLNKPYAPDRAIRGLKTLALT
jgi:DNA-binding NtrC family response regulator